MQNRFLRLVNDSVADGAPPSARSLQDVDMDEVARSRRATKGTSTGASLALMSLKELVDRDEVIFLLHSAAEVEHSLMVQYLFAALSLEQDRARMAGTAVPADADVQTSRWFRTIMSIAKQEMAHLLTVENILRALGGPLNFDREDFPFRSDLYPYPFELRALTKTSLARYVAAEMPEMPPAGTEADVEEILERLASGNAVTSRVGALYEKLIKTTSSLDPAAFNADTADWQGTVDEWGGSAPGVIIRQITDRDDAVKTLEAIAAQGEGAADLEDSHFRKFLDIYRSFPDDRPDEQGRLVWRPSKPLLHNPNTTFEPMHLLSADEAATERVLAASRITNRLTRYWAHLFNVRYRILLTTIAHSLMRQRSDTSPRTEMIGWCFDEMSNIFALLRLLADSPARQDVPASELSAGAPFELPYTMALPDWEHDRWLLQRDLLDGAAQIMATIRADPDFHDPELLNQIAAGDAQRRERVVEELALLRPCDGRGGIAP